MSYYVIERANNFEIVKVLAADYQNFLEDYGHLVKAQGPNLHNLLQQYASRYARENSLASKLQPGLSKIHKCYPHHNLLQIQRYLHPVLGWIPCSRIDPVTRDILTWKEQLAITIVAGATLVKLALTHNRTGRIIYVSFKISEILN